MNSKFLYVFFISLLAFLGLIYYNQTKIADRQSAIESSLLEQKNIGDGITRSLSKYATSDDLNKMIESNRINLSKIENDIKKIGTYIGAISIVGVPSMAQNTDGIGSTGSRPTSNPPKTISCPGPAGNLTCIDDQFGYYKTVQILDLNESFANKQVPFGQISFSASKEKPWGINIPQRDYKLFTISTFDENQRMVNYNKFTITVDGKDYDLPIASAETTQVYPESKFRWFSPRLFLGVDGGINLSNSSVYLGPSVNLGIMNYGKFDKTPDLSIMQLGVGGDLNSKGVYVQVTPVSYNIGKQLPLIDNTYLGPSFAYSPHNKNSALLLSLKVGL